MLRLFCDLLDFPTASRHILLKARASILLCAILCCMLIFVALCDIMLESFNSEFECNYSSLCSAPIAYCVAAAMACFHFSPLILSNDGVPPRPIVWDRLRSWAGSVTRHYGPRELQTLGIPDIFAEVRSPL